MILLRARKISLRDKDIFDWMRLAENDALANYGRQLRRALAKHGIPYDWKRFSLHITLVRRVKLYGTSMEETLKMLENPFVGEMEVQSISLIFSTRGKSGIIYAKVGGVEAN